LSRFTDSHVYLYFQFFYTIVGLHHYNVRYSDANLQPRLYATMIMLLTTWLPLKILGSRPWPLGSRDVIGHVATKPGTCGFLSVVHYNHASTNPRHVTPFILRSTKMCANLCKPVLNFW